ncbi:MAG: hypothetical protein V7L11_03355 [Nostoc sp.]|uniref:hypothetical protein n=1 Tax=Nostoc sp. TaxID=1180 RepID=UPI002FF5BA46
MEPQTSQQAVLDSQKLEQLKDEIKQEISEILNKSNLRNLLDKYGVLIENILTIQYTIDLSKVESSDVVVEPQHPGFLPEALGQNQHKLECWVVNGGCVTFP